MLNKFNTLINNIFKNIGEEHGNAYSSSRYLYSAIRVDESKIIDQQKPNVIVEGIEFEPSETEQGGMIIFSTEVNAIKQSENKIINWLKKKIKSIKNKLKTYSKVDQIAQKYDLVGWTVGKFLNGRYTGRDHKVYDENSISVEIVGITSETLIKIAEDICKEFEQESVMVKDYNTKKVLFVNGE